MKVDGTITKVQRSGGALTVIIDTAMGLRGIELERDEWQPMLDDFDLTDPAALVGWAVVYDPAHGDFELVDPRDDVADGAPDNAPDGATDAAPDEDTDAD